MGNFMQTIKDKLSSMTGGLSYLTPVGKMPSDDAEILCHINFSLSESNGFITTG